MPPAPLIQNVVVAEVIKQLKAMTFTVPIFDSNGKQIGTKVVSASDPGATQYGTAIGTAIFNILKNQVLVQVNTVDVVSTPAGPGTGKGTGTGVVQ